MTNYGSKEKKYLEIDSISEKKSPARVKPSVDIAFQDISFHQCVRLQRFEMERLVTFIPPDGEFTLMKYRSPDISIPFKVAAYIKEVNETRLGFEVHIISLYDPSSVGTNITVFLPIPPNTASCRIGLKEIHGHGKYEPAKGGIFWRIKKVERTRRKVDRCHC